MIQDATLNEIIDLNRINNDVLTDIIDLLSLLDLIFYPLYEKKRFKFFVPVRSLNFSINKYNISSLHVKL